jgi:hypothetical protein
LICPQVIFHFEPYFVSHFYNHFVPIKKYFFCYSSFVSIIFRIYVAIMLFNTIMVVIKITPSINFLEYDDLFM